MHLAPTSIPGVLVLEPQSHVDRRGFLRERFRLDRYLRLAEEQGVPGLGGPFVQENHSRSRRGVLRGLHFQRRRPQGKLVECIRGAVYDVVADVRDGSPTFGQWVGIELDDVTGRQLWVPPGFAHGFCVLGEEADVVYRCTEYYAPADEGGVVWNDRELAIDWPVADPILSEKDRGLPTMAMLAGTLPLMVGG